MVLLLGAAAAAHAAGPAFERARQHYQRTDYATALDLLLPLSSKDASVYSLIGKAYYMDGQYKSSISYLEKAVAGDPLNSSYYDWLGKAYGRKAEEASIFSAFSWANKTHAAFEKAVALDPSNLEALGDLFEYYLEAPGIVGGGVDKAEALAARMSRLNQPEYYYYRARLAEKRKDFRGAEAELRQAMQLEPAQIGRVIDLAEFLSRQGRFAESDALFQRAAQIDPEAPKLMFARASAYIHSGRKLDEARTLLNRYTAASITPDDPPRSEAVKLLAGAR